MCNQLVSIIVPIYNAEKKLNKCIDSLINQTYKNIEILLVDDGSTDNSSYICDEYIKSDSRIKVFHKENGGVSSARNLALNNISGDFVYFVDADDYIIPSLLEEVMKIFEEFDTDIVRFNMSIDYGDKSVPQRMGIEGSRFVDVKEFNKLLTSNVIYGNPVVQVFKRELIKDGLRFNPNIHMGEDLLFMSEIYCRSNKIYFLNKPLYYYFYDQNSASKKIDFGLRNITEYISLYELLVDIYKQYGYFSEELNVDLSTSRFVNICTNINKTILFNNYKAAYSFLTTNNTFNTILSNVEFRKLKFSNQLFFIFLKNRCKLCFNAFALFKRRKRLN